MPVSKNRKNHKQKAQSRAKKNDDAKNAHVKMLKQLKQNYINALKNFKGGPVITTGTETDVASFVSSLDFPEVVNVQSETLGEQMATEVNRIGYSHVEGTEVPETILTTSDSE